MDPQAYVKAHAAQTAIGPDAAAKSEAATAKLEEYESLSTTDALRCAMISLACTKSAAEATCAAASMAYVQTLAQQLSCCATD